MTQSSRAHWRADVKREPLMRVYGTAFPEPKMLREYQHRIAEAKKRDHRVLGVKHELFFFNGVSPGSCFWQPAGACMYNTLIDFIREKYWEYEYSEVITPNIYNFDLWHTSGHAAHYKDNMFSFNVESQEFGVSARACAVARMASARQCRGATILAWSVLLRGTLSLLQTAESKISDLALWDGCGPPRARACPHSVARPRRA